MIVQTEHVTVETQCCGSINSWANFIWHFNTA